MVGFQGIGLTGCQYEVCVSPGSILGDDVSQHTADAVGGAVFLKDGAAGLGVGDPLSEFALHAFQDALYLAGLLERRVVNPWMIVPKCHPVLDGLEGAFHVGRILAPPCGGDKLEAGVHAEHGIGEELEALYIMAVAGFVAQLDDLFIAQFDISDIERLRVTVLQALAAPCGVGVAVQILYEMSDIGGIVFHVDGK